MKTNIIKYITIFLLGSVVLSCSSTEEDLFGKSASARLDQSRQEYQQILESSTDGWVLQYFPHPEQAYGGFNYYLKFKEGKVTAKLEGVAEEHTSTYAVLNRGGNILSFNQHNPLLHKFSDPSGARPNGLGGDFEFLIVSHNENIITLKGVRTSNLCRLIKLQESVDELESRISKVRNKIRSGLLYDKDNNIEGFISVEDKQFTFKEKEGKDLKTAYVYTDKGIRLYAPLTIKDVTYQEINWNSTDESFQSENKSSIMTYVPVPIDFSGKWKLSLDPTKGMACQELVNSHNKAADAIHNRWGLFLYPQYDFGTLSGDMFGIRFDVVDPSTFSVYGSTYRTDFRGVINEPSLLDIVPIEPYPLSKGSYWQFFPGLPDIINGFKGNSPYTVEVLKPTEIKLVSKKNPNFWFILNK